MRINKYVAQATGMSRRAADQAVAEGRIIINSLVARQGAVINPADAVMLDGQLLTLPETTATVMLNKPVGYVCSRRGQGSATIYDLLPAKFHQLKPVGRLDKDSSGLLLLTNNGQLAHRLTHPRYTKKKIYHVRLDRPLSADHKNAIEDHVVKLVDGPSGFKLKALDQTGKYWQITMHEGRNRQIRRTFEACNYTVKELHRTTFGSFNLSNLGQGEYQEFST